MEQRTLVRARALQRRAPPVSSHSWCCLLQKRVRSDRDVRTNTFFSNSTHLRPFSSRTNSHVDVEARKAVTYVPVQTTVHRLCASRAAISHPYR